MMEKGKRKRHKIHITQTGTLSSGESSDDSTHNRMEQQQQMDDDQLLLDAGITVDEMGEEEKRQILEALRQSLPAPQKADPVSGVSDKASVSGEDEDSVDRVEELPEVSVSPATSAKNEDSKEPVESPEDPIPSPESVEVKDSGEELELLEDPMLNAQSQEMMSLNYDSNGNGGLECDSTTSSIAVPVPEDRVSSLRCRGGSRQRGTGQHQHFRVSEVARQELLEDDDSGSDSFLSAGTLDTTDFVTRTTRKLGEQQSEAMTLSSEQKQQGQSRFKELFSKTKSSQSQSSDPTESPEKSSGSGKKEVGSSQDLFAERASDNEPANSTQPDCSSPGPAIKTCSAFRPSTAAATTTRDTPSPSATRSSPSPSSPTEVGPSFPSSRDDGEAAEEKEGGYTEDETQPPEGFALIVDEDTLQPQETDTPSQQSPVYPTQVTHPTCSSPSPDNKDSSDAQCLTPSKLPVDDDKDPQPLLYDNLFTWHPAPPVCCLHRTYRMTSGKKKEPASESKPYFCPEGKSVRAYSEVIVCMWDAYLQHFSAVQRCLHTLLPWGKPIRAGQHHPGSLDWKKKGQPTFQMDLSNEDEDDDDDDFQEQQRRKKQLTLRRKRKVSEDDVTADSDNGKIKVEAGVSGREKDLTCKPNDGGDGESLSAYDAETQPADSDNDLPDLCIESTQAVDSSWSRTQLRQRKKRASPTHVSEDSQSSNSLLNEQGELYSTQLPRRKRAGLTETDDVSRMSKRPRRAAQTAGVKDSGRNSPHKFRPLSRKRKLVTSDCEDRHVSNEEDIEEDGEEEEVSFPQMNKVQVRRKKVSYIHISSSAEGREAKSAIVHPLPREGQSGESQGRVLPIRLVGGEEEERQPPQPSTSSTVSSTSDARGGRDGAEEEDSDDSVQYLDPALTSDPSPALLRQSPQAAGQGGHLGGEEGDEEVEVARPQAEEPMEGADSRSDELVPCPLCYKEFPRSVIERHASDCSLELEREEEPLFQAPDLSTALVAVPPASVLKRRPLRGQIDREEYVCETCNVKQGGRGALKRHFEMCRLKYGEEEASSSTRPDPPLDRRRTAFKKPRKAEGAERLPGKMLPHVEEEEEEIVTEDSDSSDKDPPFRPRGDRKREKEDKGEDKQAVSRQSKRRALPKE